MKAYMYEGKIVLGEPEFNPETDSDYVRIYTDEGPVLISPLNVEEALETTDTSEEEQYGTLVSFKDTDVLSLPPSVLV